MTLSGGLHPPYLHPLHAPEYPLRRRRGVDPGVDRGAYSQDARNQWVLCLLPQEALAEELEASLFEWSEAEHESGQGARLLQVLAAGLISAESQFLGAVHRGA